MDHSAAIEEQIKQSVQRWVRTVMQQQSWSAEEWARQASTTPTNITRILADNSSLPNADTLGRLARAAGSQPDLIGKPRVGVQSEFPSVPLLDHAQVLKLIQLSGKERTEFLQRAHKERPNMPILTRPSTTAYAFTLESDALRGRGLMKGDVLVVEPHDFSGHDVGGIAAAIVAGKLSAWLWFPPLLVPSHETEDPVAIKNAKILGRVLQLQRSL